MEITLKYRAGMVIRAIAAFVTTQDKILDVGCGNGVVSKMIQDHFRCNITGTDVVKYLKRDIPFRSMRGTYEIGAGNKEFTTALLIDVLHHLSWDGHIQLVREALRVASQVLIFEVKSGFIAKGVDIFANQVHYAQMAVPLTHRTKKDWLELFAGAGFKVESYDVPRPMFWPSKNYLFRIA